jgi:hypothetical protein
MRKLLSTLIGAALAAGLLSASPAAASTDAFQVKAVFVSATCQGGDFANVKLTALQRGGTGTINYRWDFTNNGSFDTPPSTDPATSHLYGDELTFTARVGAKDGSGATAFSTITFSTPRCP